MSGFCVWWGVFLWLVGVFGVFFVCFKEFVRKSKNPPSEAFPAT